MTKKEFMRLLHSPYLITPAVSDPQLSIHKGIVFCVVLEFLKPLFSSDERFAVHVEIVNNETGRLGARINMTPLCHLGDIPISDIAGAITIEELMQYVKKGCSLLKITTELGAEAIAQCGTLSLKLRHDREGYDFLVCNLEIGRQTFLDDVRITFKRIDSDPIKDIADVGGQILGWRTVR